MSGVISIDFGRKRPNAPSPVTVYPRETLTPRDLEILHRLAIDPSSTRKNIAADLGISINTLKLHYKRIFRVLAADNVTHACAIWNEWQRRAA